MTYAYPFGPATIVAAEQLAAATGAHVALSQAADSYLLQARIDQPSRSTYRVAFQSDDECALRSEILAEASFYETAGLATANAAHVIHGHILGLERLTGFRGIRESVAILVQPLDASRPHVFEPSGRLEWPERHWVLFRPTRHMARAALALNARGHVTKILLRESLSEGIPPECLHRVA